MSELKTYIVLNVLNDYEGGCIVLKGKNKEDIEYKLKNIDKTNIVENCNYSKLCPPTKWSLKMYLSELKNDIKKGEYKIRELKNNIIFFQMGGS